MKSSEYKNNNAKKGHLHHMWMMVLCCGAPILILGVISLLGTSFSGSRAVLTTALPFICPIMMIAMIAMMFKKDKGNGDCCEHKPVEGNENKSSNSTLCNEYTNCIL